MHLGFEDEVFYTCVLVWWSTYVTVVWEMFYSSKVLSVWGEQNYLFSIFIFYALFDMLLKGMVKSSLPSKDEPLTPNIVKVMGV